MNFKQNKHKENKVKILKKILKIGMLETLKSDSSICERQRGPRICRVLTSSNNNYIEITGICRQSNFLIRKIMTSVSLSDFPSL